MNLHEAYSKIIRELESGGRALQRYSDSEVSWLATELDRLLDHVGDPDFEKVLCLIDHSANTHRQFEAPLLKALTKDLSPSLSVFILNCCRKHIIVERFKKGHRLEFGFLEALKRLLYSSSPEVVEWTLRTIEECGSQGVYFLQEFDKIKPPPWKWFNQHQRSVREIITMLERRWSRFEKP